MANPAKRKASDDPTGDGSDGDGTAGGSAAADGPQPATSPTSRRVTPPKAKAKAAKAAKAAPATRYTPPTATQRRAPSPRWVPIAMFGLWAFGLLVIILNYMAVLPGASDGGNGWYLVVGLVSILSGIMVATQYR